ncbi:MAG TPA: DNA repair protein RecN, partial [Ferruginibacter sp.]|nr:DNA repair protein RecN [Ferruginibacter sp.]
ERADSAVLQDKEQKCIVEAMFSIAGNSAAQQFVNKYNLDGTDEIFVRREIAANGKSRSFINDTPVNLSQLKELAIHLVDLHQQFDTLSLGEETFQRNVLDALAENALLLHNLQELFGKYSASNKELEALQLQQTNANKEADYHRFLFEELDTLSLKESELEQLDAELKLLSNAENIKQQIGGVYFELAESEQPVLLQLKSLQQKLHSLDGYHANFAELHQRMNSSLLELQDIANELEHINNSIQYDAERIQIVTDRLSAGYKLLKKHNVTTTSELLHVQQELSNKLQALVNMSSEIENLQLEANKYYDEALGVAKKISTNRDSQVKSFVQKTDALLSQIGMPNAHIRVKIEHTNLSATGVDAISFLFDANKSNRFEPLHKVASGGELSRLMLAIKSLVAQKLQMPTLIFDEIDTGISGEAAKQVGIIMKQLAANHQIISITHQPQIAAKADAHYYVYKQIVNDKVETNIRPLNNDERIVNIAQMLSGEKPTAAALQNAREMVGN